ncbi:MAG: extracellular solute-binding protein, partial [Clostridia bacterium]|nr:extracellular solute-binding protein [Clostridia bacterium]
NFPQIMEQMDGLLDDVVRLCSHDGHIFGVPKSFYIMNTMLSYDAELLDELGVTLPDDDWTFADFYELAKEVRSGNVYLSGSLPLSLWDYMHQYFDPYGSGTLNDDGTALREYLTLYKKLSDEDLIYSGTYSEERELVASGELRILLGNASSDFVWKRTDVILPPSFNGERIYTVNNPYLIMNPKSQNKNAAATVIAEYLDPENRMLSMSNWGGYIYKDMSVYTHSMVYYANHEESWDNADEERRAEMLQEIEERRAEYTTNDLVNMDEKTAHNFGLYLEVLKYAKLGPSYVDEWLRFAADEQSKYLNDQQDLDYTVQRIIDRAKLILDE